MADFIDKFIDKGGNLLENEKLESVSGGSHLSDLSIDLSDIPQGGPQPMRPTGSQAAIEAQKRQQEKLQSSLAQLDGLTREQKVAYLTSIGRADLINFI